MKFLVAMMTVGLMLTGCQTTKPSNPKVGAIKEAINQQTLIIYYEQGEKDAALQAIKALGGELIYEYDRLNALAVLSDYPVTTIESLRKTKGILSAEVSKIYELH